MKLYFLVLESLFINKDNNILFRITLEVRKMKKIIAMFVMVMFLMSGIVMAQPDDLGVRSVDKKPFVAKKLDALKDKRFDFKAKEIRKPRLKNALKLRRQVTEQEVKRARQQYLQAKENYLKLRKNYLEKRTAVIDAKQDYLKCKNVDTEDCEGIRKHTREEARNFLLHTADLILNHIERIIERVNSNEDLSEEEASDILARLDEIEKEIQDAKSVIEDLDENSSKEEIKEAAKTIRHAWKKIKKDFKNSIGRVFGARLRTIIAKAEIAGERLDHTIEKLQEEGKDTSELEELVDKYYEYVDSAIDKYEEARDKWKDAVTPGEVDEIAREVHSLLKQANEDLKNAHKLLREIVKNIKEQGTSISNDDEEVEDEDNEVEEENDDDENNETNED